MLEADGSAPSASSAAAPPRSLKLSESTPTLMPEPLTLNPLSSERLLHLCRGGAAGADAGVGNRRSRRRILQDRQNSCAFCRRGRIGHGVRSRLSDDRFRCATGAKTRFRAKRTEGYRRQVCQNDWCGRRRCRAEQNGRRRRETAVDRRGYMETGTRIAGIEVLNCVPMTLPETMPASVSNASKGSSVGCTASAEVSDEANNGAADKPSPAFANSFPSVATGAPPGSLRRRNGDCNGELGSSDPGIVVYSSAAKVIPGLSVKRLSL